MSKNVAYIEELKTEENVEDKRAHQNKKRYVRGNEEENEEEGPKRNRKETNTQHKIYKRASLEQTQTQTLTSKQTARRSCS